MTFKMRLLMRNIMIILTLYMIIHSILEMQVLTNTPKKSLELQELS